MNRVVEADALLTTCVELAQAMASCVPGVLEQYKRLIDTGFGMPLSQALELESKAATESAKQASAGLILQRREGMQDRGRNQN